MTDADRAREVVDSYFRGPGVGDEAADQLEVLVTQVLTRVREEAAEIVHGLHLEMHTVNHGECVVCSVMSKIIAAIRGQEE